MGVGNTQLVDGESLNTQQVIGDSINTNHSGFDGLSASDETSSSAGAKKSLSSRTRRPDRAVYVPRAKRSQTTPPASTTSTSNPSKSRKKKSEKCKSKSVDESESLSTSNSSEDAYEESIVTCDRLDCDIINQDEKNQKNLSNFSTMSEQAKVLTIETAAGLEADKDDDKELKELMKASQEINRSNRKLIKQTFNSNVLEIEAAGNSEGKKEDEVKAVNKDEDDWDTLYDDSGDCLDPKMVEELTTAVGKVTIEKPKSDYKAYQANVDLLKDSEYPHVLECSNFPMEFREQDLMLIFSPYKASGYDIKWVDDTHCLVVFSNAKIAADVLTMSHPFIKMKPLKDATPESRAKARKCSNSLQPYKQRPETCAALAKRLVSGALGVRMTTTKEERENERRVLREARERKLLAAKAREDNWNN